MGCLQAHLTLLNSLWLARDAKIACRLAWSSTSLTAKLPEIRLFQQAGSSNNLHQNLNELADELRKIGIYFDDTFK